jgi:hypothetical protein
VAAGRTAKAPAKAPARRAAAKRSS